MSMAVLFDMDGLMLDTERIARRSWTQALAEHGYVLGEDSYLRLLGRTSQDVQQILGDLFGPGLPYLEVYRRRQVYYDADIAANGVQVKPGLLELLAYLDQRGIPKAVASSTASWFVAVKLGRAGIEHRFPVIICGDQVPRGKPEPDLFLEAARRLGVLPEQCIVLEDSEAGVLAAHRAGMLPVMVPDLKQPSPEIRALAYRVLPDLHAVISLLDEIARLGGPREVVRN